MIRRCLSASIRPASTRAAALAGAIAMLLMMSWLATRGAHRGGWRIDEAYKLSETYALHHVLRGEIHHPDWFRTRIDRTNPPFGKYVFGLAVLIAGGSLPESSSLTRADSPLTENMPLFTESESAPFLAMLPAARAVSLVATGLIAGFMAYVAARVRGVAAAVLAVALFAPHWLTDAFGATAIFDPLLTALVMATATLLLALWESRARALPIAALIGALAAMAFQTRLNGGIAFAGAVAVVAVAGLRRGRAFLVPAVALSLTFVVVTVAVNPYYWASAPPDPAIPADIRTPQSLPMRIVARFERQVRDLEDLLALFRTGGVRMPLWAADTAARARTPWNLPSRSRFLFRAIVAGAGGAVLLGGALIGAVLALGTRERGAVFLLVWCGTIVGGTCLWLPVPWSRYLFVILPPLALLSGVGWASLLAWDFREGRLRLPSPHHPGPEAR